MNRMRHAKTPYVQNVTCAVCEVIFETIFPQRICCSARCRRERLRLRKAAGARPGENDDVAFRRARDLKHPKPLRSEGR